MAKEEPLALRLYNDPLLTETARRIGYVGFPARELAAHLGELAARHGAGRLAKALGELATFERNRVMLSPKARKLCWGLLGPPPEQWDEWYRHPDGTPMKRPRGRETPPEISPGGPDPLMDGLRCVTYFDLPARLAAARKAARRGTGDHTEATAIVSEMLRRGMDVPPEETGPPAAKPRGKRGKKKVE